MPTSASSPARPSSEEEASVPHKLFGHVDAADATYSAARWAAEATLAIRDTLAEGKLPILVGGTGLYIRTLLDGIAPVPAIDPALREEVRALPVAEAHAALAQLDPASRRGSSTQPTPPASPARSKSSAAPAARSPIGRPRTSAGSATRSTSAR